MYTVTDEVTSAGYQRYKNDAYFTVDDRPVPTLFTGLPELLPQVTGVLEPTCGAGHMAEDLRALKLAVMATDIANYGYHRQAAKEDFLTRDTMPIGHNFICMNPPYKAPLVDKIVNHALDILPNGYWAAFLVLQRFDAAGGRYKLFQDGQAGFYARVVLPYRVMWFKPVVVPGKRTPGPAANHQWLVFQKGYKGPSKNVYLDPSQFGQANIRPMDMHCPDGLIGIDEAVDHDPDQGQLELEGGEQISPAMVAA